MSELMSSGTGDGLIEFLGWAADREVMNRKTAGAYRTAVSRILEVEANPGTIDIETLDVEDLLERFVRLRGGSYQPDSLTTYQSRFRKAVTQYRKYLENPDEYRGPRKYVVRRTSSAGSASAPSVSLPASPTTTDRKVPQPMDEVIQYPFPLQSGQNAYLHLPRQLQQGDVERLIRFLQSLVIDE